MSESLAHALPDGHRVDVYRIVRVLGAGGFGITYLALNEKLGESVALKEYYPADFAVRTDDHGVVPAAPDQPELFAWGLARFLEEARALHKFRHPNVVRAQGYLERRGTAYIAMDYIEGVSLAAVLQARGALRPHEWRRWLTPLLDGLVHVHGHGYRHLDIKPSNVMIQAANDQPVLIDFGQARKSLEQAPTEVVTRRHAAGQRPTSSSAERSTDIEALTLRYAAAERLTSRSVDASTDIFALAALSYLALTGTHPPTAAARMEQDRYEALTGRVAGADRAWLRGIDRGLALRPQDRPPTVAAWRTMLNESPARRPARAAAIAAGMLGAVALALWMLIPPDRIPFPAPATTEATDPRPLSQSTPSDPPDAASTPTTIEAKVDDDRTLEELRRAAVGGDPDAQTTLGVRYHQANQVERDLSAAIDWFRRAARQGYARAQYNLGVCYERGEGVEPDPEEAARWYTLAANQNYASAQHNLGTLYEQGVGVDLNAEQAVAWYQRAADQKNTFAQFALGHSYRYGFGIPRNIEGALTWYEEAADAGHLDAQLELARLYDAGDGIPPNSREAASWYLRAAEQGDVEAQFILAGKYDQGEGVLALPEEAVKWYLRAAEQNHREAQYILGIRSDRGHGVDPDSSQAELWYLRAAEQGHAEAQYALGVKYYEGDDVARDWERAAMWVRRAARGGHTQAQFITARNYHIGTPFAADTEQALMWYVRAIEGGHPHARSALADFLPELVREVEPSPLGMGEWHSNRFRSPGIQGWNFQARAGQWVQLALRSNEWTLTAYVFSPSYDLLGSGQGNLELLDPAPSFDVTAPHDGRHLILVRAARRSLAIVPDDGSVAGAYELMLRLPARTVMGQTNRGALSDLQTGLWLFGGGAGQRIELTARSEDFDTTVQLLSPAGVELAYDDDDGLLSNSRLLATLPVDGLYRVVVSASRSESRVGPGLFVEDRGGIGVYTMTVRSVVDTTPPTGTDQR